MTNYNTLTPEQKENITPYLKLLFEIREQRRINGWVIGTAEIKGFQEGQKGTIKQIDERIIELESRGKEIGVYSKDTNDFIERGLTLREEEIIEELKKQKEQLIWESELC